MEREANINQVHNEKLLLFLKKLNTFNDAVTLDQKEQIDSYEERIRCLE